jgi:hypothetical protein
MPTFSAMALTTKELTDKLGATRVVDPYIAALRGSEAGVIRLAAEDNPRAVMADFTDAVRKLSLRVENEWKTSTMRVLLWRKV